MHDRVCPPVRMRFSFESRCRLVGLIVAGMSPQAAAAACGASRATGYRLWRRYQEGGWEALRDRPPVPRRQPRRLPRELEQRILRARQSCKAGPLIVAGQLGVPASTVWKALRRYGVSRLRRPLRGPVVRYERELPGELVHVDIKKLGRFWTVGKRIHGDRLRAPAPSSGSPAATPVPDARRPTARPKRSSRPCCANGPTASPIPPAPTAPARSPATRLPALVQPTPTAAHSAPPAHQPRLTGLWVPHLGELARKVVA